MKISIDKYGSARAIGNGTLLLVCGADGVLSVGTYGAASVILRPRQGGIDCEQWREGREVTIRYYGLPPAADETLSRSAVTVTGHADAYGVVLDVAAAHELTFSLTAAEGLFFGHAKSPCFRTTGGLLGVPEGAVFLNEDEGTLTCLPGFGRLRLRREGEGGVRRTDGRTGVQGGVAPRKRRVLFPKNHGSFPKTEASSQEEGISSPQREASSQEVGNSAELILCCEELLPRQSAAGGLCLTEGATPLSLQCRGIVCLAQAGYRWPCDAFFRYVENLVSAARHLPYAATADGCVVLPHRADGEAEQALLEAMEAYVRCFGLWQGSRLPALAGWAAEELTAAYRGKSLSCEGKRALAFALAIGRREISRGQRFRIASVLSSPGQGSWTPSIFR